MPLLLMFVSCCYCLFVCFRVLDNADWWRDVSALEFVSSMARHFRLGSMLSRDR